MKIRLLVACRDERSAEAHCAALARFVGDGIAALPTTLDEVTRVCAQQRPDVLLIEHVPQEESRLWSTLHRVALVSPASRVLMLSDMCTDRLLTSFIANGVYGSLPTRATASLWAKAVVAVHRGESWFGRAVVLQALRRQLERHASEWSASADEERLLTAREREILSLIGAGMSNKEIARILSISDQTVKTHLHHIYVKLNRSGRYKAFAATPVVVAGAFPAAGRRPLPS